MRNELPNDFYSDDTLTVGAGDHEEVERLNDILEKNDLGRPLGEPSPAPGPRLIVPITSAGLSADRVRAVLAEAGAGIEPRLDPLLYAGTSYLDLLGRDIPHAFFTPSP